MTDNIEVFGQNYSRITSDGKRIYIDPFRSEISPNDADFVFITHDHHDHFSPEDIRRVSKADTVMVVPENMLRKAEEVKSPVGQIYTVKPGGRFVVRGLNFETVPAYNIMKPFHPKSAGWVGYVIECGGERIYIAGDTDATPEAGAVRCEVALLPVGGTYTMNPKQAAGLANAIRPKAVIPVHYGSIVGNERDGRDFAAMVDRDIEVVFKISFNR